MRCLHSLVPLQLRRRIQRDQIIAVLFQLQIQFYQPNPHVSRDHVLHDHALHDHGHAHASYHPIKSMQTTSIPLLTTIAVAKNISDNYKKNDKCQKQSKKKN